MISQIIRLTSFSASGNGTTLNVKGGNLAITGLITASGHDNQHGLIIKALDSGSANFDFDNVQVDSVLHLATSGDNSAINFIADNIVLVRPPSQLLALVVISKVVL